MDVNNGGIGKVGYPLIGDLDKALFVARFAGRYPQERFCGYFLWKHGL